MVAPIAPRPTIDQAIHGWRSDVVGARDAALRRPPTTCVHDLAERLVCQKCELTGKRPPAMLLQLTPRARHGHTPE
jgi:hypothetical protein